MGKKREIGIAVMSLIILAAILLVIMIFSLVLSQVLSNLRIYSLSSYMMYGVLGLSIGLSVGFGYVISKRLFDALFEK